MAEGHMMKANQNHHQHKPLRSDLYYSDNSRQPLLERATSSWHDEKFPSLPQDYMTQSGFRDLENARSSSGLSQKLLSSRRSRRMLPLILVVLGLALCTWKWYPRLQPHLNKEWDIREGFLRQENGTYDVVKSGNFDGIRLETLEASLVPGGVNDPEGKRRLVFVGDIHGCARELKKLLKRIDFDDRTDHLIAVGDTISKGPDSAGVLDELVRLGATSVRGNHEDRILALAPTMLETSLSSMAEETSSRGAEKDAALIRQLSKHHLEYLKSMPLMLRIPTLSMADTPNSKDNSPLAEELLVVHAGLVPAISLEKQDPFYVMNMRAIQTKTHLPLIEAAARKTKSRPWHNIWGWYNDRLFRKKSLKDFAIWDDLAWDAGRGSWLGTLGLVSEKKWPQPQVVIYGHHAKAGLQIDRWSKGLDTGCVRGGKLTAMVLDARGRQTIVSVGCEDNRQ